MSIADKINPLIKKLGLDSEQEEKSLSEQVEEFRDSYDIDTPNKKNSGSEEENEGPNYRNFSQNADKIKSKVKNMDFSDKTASNEQLKTKVDTLRDRLKDINSN